MGRAVQEASAAWEEEVLSSMLCSTHQILLLIHSTQDEEAQVVRGARAAWAVPVQVVPPLACTATRALLWSAWGT